MDVCITIGEYRVHVWVHPLVTITLVANLAWMGTYRNEVSSRAGKWKRQMVLGKRVLSMYFMRHANTCMCSNAAWPSQHSEQYKWWCFPLSLSCTWLVHICSSMDSHSFYVSIPVLTVALERQAINVTLSTLYCTFIVILNNSHAWVPAVSLIHAASELPWLLACSYQFLRILSLSTLEQMGGNLQVGYLYHSNYNRQCSSTWFSFPSV